MVRAMSPPLPPRRRLDAAEARDRRILAAARHSFAAWGFEATTMGAVAREAGVAVGTLYLRAPTKEALLGRVLEQLEAELARVMEEAAATTPAWADRFPAVFGALLRAVAAMPDLPRLMGLAHHVGPRGPGPIRAWIAGFLRAGQAAGALRPMEPELAAAMAFGLVEGAMAAHAERPGRPAEETVAALADAARRWLLARGDEAPV